MSQLCSPLELKSAIDYREVAASAKSRGGFDNFFSSRRRQTRWRIFRRENDDVTIRQKTSLLRRNTRTLEICFWSKSHLISKERAAAANIGTTKNKSIEFIFPLLPWYQLGLTVVTPTEW